MNAAPDDTEYAREARRKIYEAEFAAVQLGTQNQRERFLEDLLPEDELLALARAELFKPFDGFRRWAKDTRLHIYDVRHSLPCEKKADWSATEAIVFETCQADELSHDEWVIYRQMGQARDAADRHAWLTPGSVTIEPLTHFATCSVCQAEVCRMSVKITITWAGRKLVREFLLK